MPPIFSRHCDFRRPSVSGAAAVVKVSAGLVVIVQDLSRPSFRRGDDDDVDLITTTTKQGCSTEYLYWYLRFKCWYWYFISK